VRVCGANLTFKGIDVEAYAVVFGLAVEARGIGHIAGNCELALTLINTIEREFSVKSLCGEVVERLLGSGEVVGLYKVCLVLAIVDCLTFE
jgi:hypothetical protein